MIVATKNLGSFSLALMSNRDGRWALVTNNWCSGFNMSRREARSYFDSLTTAAQLSRTISDAYDSASGREC